MATSFANLLYHIVFSTKERVPLIQESVREPIYEYIGGILRTEGCILLEIGGMPDHVHILAKIKPAIAVAEAIRLIKTNSSRWVNESRKMASRFEWQAGYAAFSVSESQVAEVRRYIQTQEQHHARISFHDELIALLKKNRIEYDERYLLG
jgi:REP-associated tyrosine transposase